MTSFREKLVSTKQSKRVYLLTFTEKAIFIDDTISRNPCLYKSEYVSAYNTDIPDLIDDVNVSISRLK